MSPPQPFYTIILNKVAYTDPRVIYSAQRWPIGTLRWPIVTYTPPFPSTNLPWLVLRSDFWISWNSIQFWAGGETIHFYGEANIFCLTFLNTYYSNSITLLPEWFQPFENIDFISVGGELQHIRRGWGGDKNSENMLVFSINSNSHFSFFYFPNTPMAGA